MSSHGWRRIVNARIAIAATFVVALLGALASFILTTVAMDSLPDAVLVGASGLVAFALVASLGGWRVAREFLTLERRTLYLALGGGALAFWAAPLLALTQRSSNAPSGADTLFFTTTLWAVLVVLGAYVVRGDRLALTGIAGAVCAAAGTAGLLASWEYPSSFSPFAKFPAREASMLVAGLLFAAGVLALAEAARRMGVRYATTLGLGAAATLGVLASLPGLSVALAAGSAAWRPSVYLGVAIALFAVSWTWLATQIGAARASASMLLVPPAMTALVIYERATAVYGVVPFEMRGLAAGSAIAVVGVAVLLLSTADRVSSREGRGQLVSVALWIAVASCMAAAVSLGTPALDALSEGHVSELFRVAWTMLGFESAAGWMPVAAAFLALTAALEARKGQAVRAWVAASLAVFACAAAMPVLSATTLHIWNSWIPAEVQQTYGTEYARFSVAAVVDPVRIGAMALAVVSAGMLGLSVATGAKPARSTEAGS
jgi:drug/metabolite transporter (DMT)-like permease